MGPSAAPANLTSLIDPNSLTALVTNLDLTSPSQAEWYTFTAPATTSGTLTVTVQSSGLSLLTPQATLYASDGNTVLASASGVGRTDGCTLTLTVSNVTPGQVFYLKVTGADSSVFSTGTYALTLNFGTGPSPTMPLPNTTTPNGSTTPGGSTHGTGASFEVQAEEESWVQAAEVYFAALDEEVPPPMPDADLEPLMPSFDLRFAALAGAALSAPAPAYSEETKERMKR
jgi:hypothetical protein